MVINRDGTGLRRLTAGIDPALSPDGSKVAFTRWDSGNQGFVWTINMDGSGETRVMGGARQAKSPTWSPDGTQIAINYQEGGTLDPVEKCQDFVDGEPDFNFWIAYDFRIKYQTINGQKIPVAICWTYPPDAHWGLRVIDVQAQSYEDMPSSLYTFGPAWDPANAWRVVSSGGQGLVWTDVLRGVSEPLTDDPSDRGPAFSPDGQYMALTYLQADHWEIHRLNADGSGRVRLTKLPLYAVAEDIKTWNNASPIFSPDGSEIAFVTDRTGRWEIWVMNVDGSNQRPMFSDEINDQLPIQYDNNDERVVRWGS
jgi:TolB protein